MNTPLKVGCKVNICSLYRPPRVGVIAWKRTHPVSNQPIWGVNDPAFPDPAVFSTEPDEKGRYYNPNRAYWIERSDPEAPP